MTVRIIVLRGKTFRGIYHYYATKYDVSEDLARHVIKEGIAELDLGQQDPK